MPPSNPTLDLVRLQQEKEKRATWSARMDHASASLELATLRERLWQVLALHEPVASMNLDRDDLRNVMDYILTGRWD